MGRRPRSKEEIDSIKNKILECALTMIVDHGYEEFSIRKLGPQLGIAPKTVYNYFKNKDEIYLHVLTRGFEILYQELYTSAAHLEAPFDKLSALARAYVRFGKEKPNYYDIMLTRYIPKYNEFVGKPQESIALQELQAALKPFDFLVQVMEEILAIRGVDHTRDAHTDAAQLMVTLHGMVSLKNNSILGYISGDPDKLVDTMLKNIIAPFNPGVSQS